MTPDTISNSLLYLLRKLDSTFTVRYILLVRDYYLVLANVHVSAGEEYWPLYGCMLHAYKDDCLIYIHI